MGFINGTQNDWVCVDIFNLSATTLATFSSSGGSVRQYPVNSAIDGGLKVVVHAVGNAAVGVGGTNYRLNGGTTSQTSVRLDEIDGAAPITSSFSHIGIPTGVNNPNAVAVSELTIENVATGQNRISLLFRGTAGSTNRSCGSYSGLYANTATAITSIDITWASGAGQSGRLWLYVKNPQLAPIWAV